MTSAIRLLLSIGGLTLALSLATAGTGGANAPRSWYGATDGLSALVYVKLAPAVGTPSLVAVIVTAHVIKNPILALSAVARSQAEAMAWRRWSESDGSALNPQLKRLHAEYRDAEGAFAAAERAADARAATRAVKKIQALRSRIVSHPQRSH